MEYREGVADGTGITIEAFRLQVEGTTLEKFVAAWPMPFLLQMNASEANPLSPLETVRGPINTDETRRDMTPPVPLFVHPIRKRHDHKTPTITLGRSPQNDLVLDEPAVSRFHGAFLPEGDIWTFVDKSSGGTWVDGRKIPTLRPYPLRPGSAIALGNSVYVTFLTPQMCFEAVAPR